MKKLFFAVFAALFALCSCQMDELAGHVEEDVLYVKIEESSVTKTYMGAGNKVLWSEGDQIAAFMKSYEAAKYQVAGESVGNSSAVFTKVSGSGSSGNSAPQHNVAFYPYSFVSSISKSGNNYVADVNVPSVQTYRSESFDDGFFPMAAVSKDNTLSFRNICGAVNLRLTGSQKVKSVSLSGNSGEKISGAGTVTVYPDNSAPYLKLKSSASSSVTLDCGDGVQLNESQATSFVIVLPPVEFSKGFTMTVTDSEGTEYEIRTDKSNSISRSNIHAVPVLKLGDDFGGDTDAPEYIDENGVNHGPGVEIDGVVWAPVNCGYHEIDYPWGKLYQWGRKYGQGYSGAVYDANSVYMGTYSDATVPTLRYGPVPLSEGQLQSYENYFYWTASAPNDWLALPDDNLWNSGTEDNPVKTEYDPCPDGWRVPTYSELNNLKSNRSSWTSNSDNQPGYWFSGSNSYSSLTPSIFLPAAIYRYYRDGQADNRGIGGYYWSSAPKDINASFLCFLSSGMSMSTHRRACGFSVRCVEDKSELIPVSSVSVNKSSLTMEIGETQTLSATISPSNANHKTAYWWSEDEAVATVDKNGKVTAVSSGVTTITAMAGMKHATCTVTVNSPASNQKEYIDENGVNHGPGVEIDGVVWAPVNCGYHETDYKYGKLYQWGRKYGQGYSGGNYDINGNNVGTYSDASVPSIKSGPVSLGTGQSKSNSNVFYTSDSDHHYDWLSPQNEYLWNAGTESNPVKTEYDPCPEGWRVPTYSELENLIDHYSSWTTDENGQVGYWFSGSSSYSSNSPRVFFPAEGCLGDRNGNSNSRGLRGYYWSSMFSSCEAGCIRLYNDELFTSLYSCATGFSVRCVEDEAELIPVSSVSINKSSLTMEIGETQTLSATISPSNANHKTAYWWSEDEAIATVDKNGKVTAVSSGVAKITAMAGMKQATCTVTVNAPVSNQKEYIDENGVNHGPGIEIDGVVWAPVNCGYHETDYPWGKLYQWGRKDGQGYSDEDETSAVIMSGPVSLYTGQLKTNEAKFYKNNTSPYDWLSSSESNLWNLGTEGNPIKTEYDPCPEGWRVPTYSELKTLSVHSSWGQNEDGQNGLWFSGLATSTDAGSKVFFSAAGGIYYTEGSSLYRDSDGSYWSSRPYGELSYELRVCNNPKNVGMGGYYRATGYSVRCVQDEEELIPVSSVSINKSSLTMEIGETQTLSATISPSDANHQTAYWWSEDETVATVDKNGKVTAVSSGVTTITAMAGMKQATCTVTVNAPASNQKEYIDENGVNHGPGIEIDGVVWAPVNCGYHKTDYKYGKLYQWGRKYGQGYSGSFYDINGNKVGTYSDASVPSIKSGPVSLTTGQSKSNSNVFYTSKNFPYDWLSPQDDNLWNAGSESNPLKTEYDPCPDGWRVPTYAELDNLNNHYSSWTTDENGQVGYWFSGSSSYSSSSQKVFLPAAGYRGYDSGGANFRGYGGNYWSSRPNSYYSYYLGFYSGYVGMYDYYRAYGHSVRCVQDEEELISVSSVSINKSSLTMEIGETQTLSATISPSDANHKTAYWWSEDETVATVDKNGKVTAVSSGVTTITAMVGMKHATCKVTVNAPASNQKEYIDENGVNHGPGVEIDGVVWAPVNCGYHETDYPWGMLYQWGRKYGQGYSGNLWDINENYVGDYSDGTVPSIKSGPVSLATGQSKSNSNVFYTSDSNHDYDWLYTKNDYVWNAGTESNPVKTEYDPCPEGWRVPTYSELYNLSDHYSSWTTDENGQVGYWFSGSSSYSSSSQKVFLPAAGDRSYFSGGAYNRGYYGNYWSSRPLSYYSSYLFFYSGDVYMDDYGRAYGHSVRCVQE